MKKRWGFWIMLVCWVALAVLLAFFLSETQEYQLSSRGQQHIFLFDWSFILGYLGQPGGAAELKARFLTQFFSNLQAGPVITSVLVVLMAIMTWLPLKKLGAGWSSIALSLPAPLFLLISLLDPYFYYQGVIALFIAVFFLCIYLLADFRKWQARLLSGCIAIVLVHWLAGSVALLFAVSVVIADLLLKREKALCSLSYIILAFAAGAFSVFAGQIGTFTQAFTPAFYYEMMALPMPSVHWLSWVLLPVSLGLAFLLGKIRGGVLLQGTLGLILAIMVFMPFIIFHKSHFSEERERICHLEHLAFAEDSDGIISSFGGKVRSDSEANYLNLALARKGILLQNLFSNRTRGPFALITDTKSQDVSDLVRLSQVLYAMGNYAAAQSMAFNANQALDVSPALQKMICRIDLMRGSYGAASKSVTLLEKTVCRSWAKSQRKFLFNDLAVEEDPVLGNGRKDFPKEESFVLYSNPMDDLYRIVEANPGDSRAVQYALAYLLLAKDTQKVVEFVDRWYGTEALPSLPLPVQECLVFYADYYQMIDEDFALNHGMSIEELLSRKAVDTSYCLSRGVGKDVLERFSLFKRKYGLVRGGQSALSEMSPYLNTFWYYLLFVDINEGVK